MEAHSTCVKKRNHVTDCHTLKTCISCQSDQRYNGKMRTNDYSTGQTTLLPLAALSNNLARVLLIRCIVIAGLFIALYYCFAIARISLQYTLLSSLLVGFSLFTFFSFLRLNLKTPITQTEFVIQLLMDTCFITLLLYFSGGSSNPFVSYYLVPVTIAAATLRSVHTWLITLLSLAAYTLLLFFHTQIPEFLPPHHHAATQGINLHIVGMWVGFAVSAILITFFVVRMAAALRAQENHINQSREAILRDEQIMAVATLAAGTAHELGTPLSSILVLIDELLGENQQDDSLHRDLVLIRQEVERCRSTLRKLTQTADHRNNLNLPETSLQHFINTSIENWQVLRPDVSFRLQMTLEQVSGKKFRPPHTLEQSLINLLNNAADANPDNIDIAVSVENNQLVIEVSDKGPGIDRKLADSLGTAFISTKNRGLGLGLFLTQASITRFGGKVNLYNRPEGGTLTRVEIPLEALELS